VANETGLETVPVTAVASHDSASAVAAIPAAGERFGYISCGTWSLVGVELPLQVLTAESREANFTNERGIDGTVRYLRNVMGLWLLQECLRAWDSPDLGELLAAAADVPPLRSVIAADDPEFLPPGDMPARIAAHCERHGTPVPETRAEIVRCVLDSLALAHRAALRRAADLSGRSIEVVHLVGGGSRNELLCRLTADACGLPVVAGPVEATALGNVLVQARAHGAVGGLEEMRDLVARTQPLRRYEPHGDERAWSQAAARIGLS
jgi:rhamnulokinase